MLRVLGIIVVFLLAAAAGIFFFVVPARVDASLNRVIPHDPYPISEASASFHSTLRLADLHDGLGRSQDEVDGLDGRERGDGDERGRE